MHVNRGNILAFVFNETLFISFRGQREELTRVYIFGQKMASYCAHVIIECCNIDHKMSI